MEDKYVLEMNNSYLIEVIKCNCFYFFRYIKFLDIFYK